MALSLMLFGAQHRGDNKKTAVEILARSFQPMITLFILYYLDSRTSLDEEMPWWMVLFGVVYDEKGFSIQSFYPAFTPSSPCCQTQGWGASSTTVTDFYQDIMQRPPDERSPPLSILYRVQGHCRFVYEQLSKWEGLERTCRRLQGSS
jgi:hypothetical protein